MKSLSGVYISFIARLTMYEIRMEALYFLGGNQLGTKI